MPASRPIVHILPAEPYGGLQALVIELARAQRSAGKNVEILLLDDSPRVIARCRAAGIEPIALAGSTLARMVALRKELHKARGAILHSHCEPIWASPILAAWRSSWISHLHVYARHDGVRDWVMNIIRRFCARRFIAVSHSLGENGSGNYLAPAKRIGVVYNGLDFANFPAPLRNRNTPFTIAFVGRAVREKGLFDFIEVAGILRDTPGLQFVIAGEGGDLNQARALIQEKGLEDRVSVLGFIDNPQDVWRTSDLLLMLSTREPFGLVIIEAIASGVAVLGYDTESGGSEVMANLPGCHMVRAFDIPALAEAVEQAAVDKDLRDRVLYGRDIALRKYSLSRMEAEVTAEYERAGLTSRQTAFTNPTTPSAEPS